MLRACKQHAVPHCLSHCLVLPPPTQFYTCSIQQSSRRASLASSRLPRLHCRPQFTSPFPPDFIISPSNPSLTSHTQPNYLPAITHILVVHPPLFNHAPSVSYKNVSPFCNPHFPIGKECIPVRPSLHPPPVPYFHSPQIICRIYSTVHILSISLICNNHRKSSLFLSPPCARNRPQLAILLCSDSHIRDLPR